MKKTPLVSIIMPLYNKRPYVMRAINSIQQQTFTNWELIIIDDGSTDGSPTEIPPDEPRIRFFQQANSGPSAARNHGIRMVRGEFVTFIDADNYYYPQKLEQDKKLFEKYATAEWMVSAFDYESKSHVKLFRFIDIEGNKIEGPPLIINNSFLQLRIAGWHIEGLCIKKTLLERLGGFNEDMRYGEITEFMIRCALIQPRVLIYPNPLFRLLDVPDSASKQSSHIIEGMRQMGESLYKFSKDYPEISETLKLKSQKSLLSYVANLILSGKSKKARRYLTKEFPYPLNKRWWKMWIGSWVPKWLLQNLVNTGSDGI
jgi:glycosyltransferase involved in cell wall biosynthesis